MFGDGHGRATKESCGHPVERVWTPRRENAGRTQCEWAADGSWESSHPYHSHTGRVEDRLQPARQVRRVSTLPSLRPPLYAELLGLGAVVYHLVNQTHQLNAHALSGRTPFETTRGPAGPLDLSLLRLRVPPPPPWLLWLLCSGIRRGLCGALVAVPSLGNSLCLVGAFI